jgi:hypothetical protein
MESTQKSPRSAATGLAINVLKGALIKVLGVVETGRSTVQVKFSQDHRARMTIQLPKKSKTAPVSMAKPTEEDMKEVLRLANEKIAEDAAVTFYRVNKAEFESVYGGALPYDGCYYRNYLDKEEFTVLCIDGWNVNAVTGTESYLSSTGGLGQMMFEKYKFVSKKMTLEVQFKVVPDMEKASSNVIVPTGNVVIQEQTGLSTFPSRASLEEAGLYGTPEKMSAFRLLQEAALAKVAADGGADTGKAKPEKQTHKQKQKQKAPSNATAASTVDDLSLGTGDGTQKVDPWNVRIDMCFMLSCSFSLLKSPLYTVLWK